MDIIWLWDSLRRWLVCDILRNTLSMLQSEEGVNSMVIERISFQPDSEEAVPFISIS